MSSGAVPCCEPPDPCKKLLEEIQEFLDNLKKRAAELRANTGNLPLTKPSTPHPRYGTRSIEGERHQFQGRQEGLRKRLNDYNSKGCGPPPPPEAWRFATMDAPEAAPRPEPAPDNTARNVAAAGATVGLGYIAYRVIRLLPSLLAPPTLIPNLAIP